MNCPHCQTEMLPGDTGYVCQKGCGKIVPYRRTSFVDGRLTERVEKPKAGRIEHSKRWLDGVEAGMKKLREADGGSDVLRS